MAERVTFSTTDGVAIVGDYYAGPTGLSPAVVLLHMMHQPARGDADEGAPTKRMFWRANPERSERVSKRLRMPAERASWANLARALQADGFQALAIDLRGHGESVHQHLNGRPPAVLDYKKFSDAEHQASINDVIAAVEWLVRRGSLRESVALAGASIGANLALQYLAQDARHRAAILLSPGLDYRGIAAEPLVRRLREGQAVYFVSAEDDGDNAEMVKRLFNAVPLGVAKEIRIFAQGGHGTTMLERDGSISVQLIQWLRRLYY